MGCTVVNSHRHGINLRECHFSSLVQALRTHASGVLEVCHMESLFPAGDNNI
ncbi:hypothetical protein DPMN_017559 [Dreissena polymorpha]|uniref:Uncharacterized protein n=1 Tax=Dreissena polymorpha TaxID=45954 RepID=A0A9D4NHQ1_DREPO|nr:hypothetical protein DPMN_017559 [Dreissena polymorpha]